MALLLWALISFSANCGGCILPPGVFINIKHYLGLIIAVFQPDAQVLMLGSLSSGQARVVALPTLQMRELRLGAPESHSK